MISGVVSLHSASIFMDVNVSRTVFRRCSDTTIFDAVFLIFLMMCFLNGHSEYNKQDVEFADASIDRRSFDSILIILAIFQESRDSVRDIHTSYFSILEMMRETHDQRCFNIIIIYICTKIMMLFNHSVNLSE